jgi:DNA-directed RNA polymerase subunit RPC12/RpoP
VDQLTRNHDCSKCGRKIVNDGAALVVCGHCGNFDLVEGITRAHSCAKCGRECRR